MATTARASKLRQSFRLRLGSAHQSAGLIALLGLGFALLSLITQPPNRDTIHSLAMWLMVATALGYLLATAASQWTLGHRLRNGSASNWRGPMVLRAVTALGVLIVFALILIRGSHSNVLLARVETLLSAVGTVAGVVFVLTLIDLATQAAPAAPSDADEEPSGAATPTVQQATTVADWIGSIAAGGLVLAILWAELSGLS